MCMVLLCRFKEAVGDYNCPDKKAGQASVAAERTPAGPFVGPKADAGEWLLLGYGFLCLRPQGQHTLAHARCPVHTSHVIANKQLPAIPGEKCCSSAAYPAALVDGVSMLVVIG